MTEQITLLSDMLPGISYQYNSLIYFVSLARNKRLHFNKDTPNNLSIELLTIQLRESQNLPISSSIDSIYE